MSAFAVIIAGWILGAGAVSGQVVDAAGNGVPGAMVYIEQGLGGKITATAAGADGAFRFDNVEPGRVNVFAKATGLALGGDSPNLTSGADATSMLIRLLPPDSVAGKLTDPKGDPVVGAKIVRVGLKSGNSRVSIPLGALEGFPAPVSGTNGAFIVDGLPQGQQVALKINHPGFALEGVPSFPVGERGAEIMLQPGVAVKGRVVSRDGMLAISNAEVLIRNDDPPNETTVASSDMKGEFLVRLKPGYYGCQAVSADMRSPGWQKLTITGESGEQTVTVRVAGVGEARGQVMNAVTGGPVAGARLSLSAFGNPAAVVTTDMEGWYVMRVSEGENTIILESAPGCLPPAEPVLRIQVKEGQKIELPVYWVKPIPECGLTVLDEAGAPLPGAVVTLVRPAQFGWRVTDANGRTPLQYASLPKDGVVVGMAEHPTNGQVAAFRFDVRSETAPTVQVRPMGVITGKVINDKKKPLEGAAVAIMLAQSPSGAPIVLWRSVASTGGAFAWRGAPTGVELKCAATAGGESIGESAVFTVKNEASHDIGGIVVAGGKKDKSLLGANMKNALPENARGGSALLIYCAPVESTAVAEGLKTLSSITGPNLKCVMIVNGAWDRQSLDGVATAQGSAPGPASTYLLNAEGIVVSETFDLPSLSIIRELAEN